MTADEVKRLLGLEPHPREGGWYVRAYESRETLKAEAFGDRRYGGPRRIGTAIYYLLEPGTFSEMHRLKSDEIFHFYAGSAVQQLQLRPDGSGVMVRIGNDLGAGERPQVVVERGTWQGARLAEDGTWALLGCTVTPGFEFDDYESGIAQELVRGWPQWEQELKKLCRS